MVAYRSQVGETKSLHNANINEDGSLRKSSRGDRRISALTLMKMVTDGSQVGETKCPYTTQTLMKMVARGSQVGEMKTGEE
ncbi:hypothetical protein RRG08_040566 [Elysia crispata]|uniref:Uncharacterized protein n=1 Tax=Elysia crispata TaxID=231223 RepID=A0AAE0Z8D9_9GAST|nr:hypothetical protein RRG08_040566 [Elysia crispata]